MNELGVLEVGLSICFLIRVCVDKLDNTLVRNHKINVLALVLGGELGETSRSKIAQSHTFANLLSTETCWCNLDVAASSD